MEIMRILILSDIHANLPAFEAVLDNAAGKWDEIWCLGDLVGYGPNPNECVELLRRQDYISLSGNHDWATLGKLDLNDFNDEARSIVLWTQNEITPETCTFLDTLPAKRVVGDFTLAHGSPRHPVWEYVIQHDTAVENFAHFDTAYCLVGHTHTPVLIAEKEPGDILVYNPTYAETIYLEDTRVIINPGSVGQPRDSDPRAAYALLDTDDLTWEFYRVSYPIEDTQDQMRELGFPEPIIARLAYGW